MLKLLPAYFAFILFAGIGAVSAQNRIISGTVNDEKGKPVAYLTVQVKGTTIGTYTDTSGKFMLAVDSASKRLLLSYPGMKDLEVAISDNMAITMKSDVLGLDEVVVTAIGIPVEKKALGYETQTVGSEDLNTSGTGNMMNELEGKVSGMQVISSSGDPGSGTYINLRGPTALSGNNAPLMVVDGIPIDNSINVYEPNTGIGFSASGAGGLIYGGVSPSNRGVDINPSDIESITVLKGPAATALYGIEAANGALIITTKKAHNGEEGLGIDFNSSLSFSTYNKMDGLQNQYSQGYWSDTLLTNPKSAYYSGPRTIDPNIGYVNPYSWGPPISQLSWDGNSNPYDVHGNIVYDTAHGVSKAGGPVHAYNPLNFFQTGVAADNNIAFSHGNERAGFRISAGNLNQTGIIPGAKYNKNTFSINGQTTLNKKMSVSGGMNYVNSVTDKVQQAANNSGVMQGLLQTPPTFDNANGITHNAASNKASYILPTPGDSQRDFRGTAYTGFNSLGYQNTFYDNPYWTVNENPFVSTLNRVYGFGQVEYHILDWMTLKFNGGGDVYYQDDKNYFSPYSSTAIGSGGAYITDYFNHQYNTDLTLNAQRKLTKDLNLNVILGENYFTSGQATNFTQGTGLGLPYLLDISNATSYFSSQSEYSIRRSAWYGEAILGYKSMLFLTLTGRDETTSTLSPDADNFFYPSADLGWVFTEPLHLSTNKIFPYGKLRASYAAVGQDANPQELSTPYHTGNITDMFITGVQFPFTPAGSNTPLPGWQVSNVTSTIGNPGLRPQSTTTFELGTDLEFFQGILGFSATYYSERTEDEIYSVPIPGSAGGAYAILNAGVVTNKGLELTLNATPLNLKNGFRWDVTLNWSKNSNKLVYLAPGVQNLLVGWFQQYDIPGYPINELVGQDFVRVPGTLYDPKNPMTNLLISDVPNSYSSTNGTYAGYGLPQVSPNEQPLASTQPNWLGGITNTFSYKGISLGIVVSIRDGGYMYDGTQAALNYYGASDVTANRGQPVTFHGEMGHISTSTGQIVHYNSMGQEVPGAGSLNTYQASYSLWYYQYVDNIYSGLATPFIYDASYVRVSQLSVGYDLPKRWVRKMHFTRLNITLFSTNPFLWTKYPGIDPESNASGPANSQGGEYFNNPNAKSYGVRLNVGI